MSRTSTARAQRRATLPVQHRRHSAAPRLGIDAGAHQHASFATSSISLVVRVVARAVNKAHGPFASRMFVRVITSIRSAPPRQTADPSACCDCRRRVRLGGQGACRSLALLARQAARPGYTTLCLQAHTVSRLGQPTASPPPQRESALQPRGYERAGHRTVRKSESHKALALVYPSLRPLAEMRVQPLAPCMGALPPAHARRPYAGLPGPAEVVAHSFGVGPDLSPAGPVVPRRVIAHRSCALPTGILRRYPRWQRTVYSVSQQSSRFVLHPAGQTRTLSAPPTNMPTPLR
jgi:hypothetical protein